MAKFLVNLTYDSINQKRFIELINLNDVFKKKLIFTEDQIRIYFENNKDKYNQIYKSVKLLDFEHKTDLKEGLTKMWEWAKLQPKRDQFVWENYELDEGIYEFWK